MGDGGIYNILISSLQFLSDSLHQFLDGLRGRILRAILKLPLSTATDMLFLPADKLGLQYRSLLPTYVLVAAQSLATRQEDKGRLGTLARALSAGHIAAVTPKRGTLRPTLAKPLTCWIHSRPRALCLRRAAWIHEYGIHVITSNSPYSLARPGIIRSQGGH